MHYDLFNISKGTFPNRPYFLKMTREKNSETVEMWHTTKTFDQKAGLWVEREGKMNVSTDLIVNVMEDENTTVSVGDTVNFQGPGKYTIEQIVSRQPSAVPERFPFRAVVCTVKVKIM